MDTPGQPERGLIQHLYGECPTRINHRRATMGRRALLAGALALPAPWARASRGMLERALQAMGGRQLIARVRAVSWVESRHLPIGARIRIEPFRLVRIQPWSFAPPKPGWDAPRDYRAEDSRLTPMQMRVTQDFGLFSHMLLLHSTVREEGHRLIASRPGYAPATLVFGRGGRLLRAFERLYDFATRAPVLRHTEFEGEVSDQGVRWPARYSASSGGYAPNTISISEFKVELD